MSQEKNELELKETDAALAADAAQLSEMVNAENVNAENVRTEPAAESSSTFAPVEPPANTNEAIELAQVETPPAATIENAEVPEPCDECDLCDDQFGSDQLVAAYKSIGAAVKLSTTNVRSAILEMGGYEIDEMKNWLSSIEKLTPTEIKNGFSTIQEACRAIRREVKAKTASNN